MKFFNEDKFYRFLWYDPISKDINICNPKRMAKIAQEVHANAIHYVATTPLTGNTFYPSKYRKMEPLTGGKDILKEMVEECHKRKIKLIAYFNCHWVLKESKPEGDGWLTVLKSGDIFDMAAWYGKGFCPCVNSPDYLAESIGICKELVTNYDIDGIFFDGPSFPIGTCYCKHCQKKFKSIYGAEIPKEELWGEKIFENFMQFRFDSIAQYLAEIRKETKKVRDIPIYKNGAPLKTSWFNAITSEYHAPQSDIIGGEHFVFYSNPFNTNIWGAGAVAKYHKAIAGKDKPAIVYLCYAHKVWDFYPLPAADIKNIIAETAANGAYPFVTMDDYLTVNDSLKLAPVKEMFSFIEKNENIYLGAESYNNVALYWSQTTADFYTHGVLKGAGGTHHIEVESDKEYIKEFEGFYDILTQAHIPFDILVEKDLNEKGMEKYDCVIMPNTACLNEAQAQEIRKFVENGGNLIASNEVSLYEEKGVMRKDFLISDLLGVSTGGINTPEDLKKFIYRTKIDYQKISAKHVIVNSSKISYLPAALDNVRVKAALGTQVLAKFMNPLNFRYDCFKGVSDHPSITVNKHGKGKVIYFAGNVGALYLTFNVRDIRDIVSNAVRWLVEVPLILEKNYSLDINLTETKDGSKALHIINWSTRIKRPSDEIVPVRDIKVKLQLKEKPKAVKTLASNKKLKATKAGKYYEFVVPEVKDYEVIVIK